MTTATNPASLIEPGQTWTVDSFRPEDALGVTDLFKLVYGEGYPIRTFVDPAVLTAENLARRTISSVIRTAKGEVIGHNALFQSSASPKAFELGSGVVHPAYRGGAGLFKALVFHGQELAPGFGIELTYGEPVCNHPFSQRLMISLGYPLVAVEVDLMPAATYAQEKASQGRVSTILAAKPLKPRPHRVHLPAAWAEALALVYQSFADARELAPSQGRPPAEARTVLEARVFPFAQVARLAVPQVGADCAAQITAKEAELAGQGVIVFQVWLPLACPWLDPTVAELRARGYFLGGLLPRWFDEDGLLVQKVLGRPNWEGMYIHQEQDKKFVALVRADWEQAQG
jgi:hypothetical protein